MNYYIFGLQRSGTNYVEQLIRANYKGNRLNNGSNHWKHHIEIPAGLRQDAPIIMLYKNPYLWVESLCFRNSVDWVTTQLKYPPNTGPAHHLVGKNKLNIVSLAKTYKDWHNTWSAQQHIGYLMKYEDLLNEKGRIRHFSNLEKKYTLRRIRNEFVDIPKGQVGQSRDYNDKRHSYYQSQKTSNLTPEQKALITSTLGPGNIKKWGYDIQ